MGAAWTGKQTTLHGVNTVTIQHQSILKVADNPGAKTVKRTKIPNGSGKRYALIGDCVIVPVRSLKSGFGAQSDLGGRKPKRSTTIRKGQISKASVIRTKKGVTYKQRKCRHGVAPGDNEAVSPTGSNQGNLVGSRIFGPITRELRAKNYRKVISQPEKILQCVRNGLGLRTTSKATHRTDLPIWGQL